MIQVLIKSVKLPFTDNGGFPNNGRSLYGRFSLVEFYICGLVSHCLGLMSIAESSKTTTPVTGISGTIQTTTKKLTVQSEEVALRLIPAAATAEIKRSAGSDSASDMGTCRIIVAPNSEAVLKENLLIDSGGSGSESWDNVSI